MNKRISEIYVRSLVSHNLKRLRYQQNISQMELALSAGLAHNSINDIENCKKGISCKSIAKLCMALRAEPYQFFLPENIPDDKISVYINELKDSVQKAVNDVTSQYIQANDKNTV